MTLYELIERVSALITPKSNDFYNYVLNTSDDNGGFLRTCYCWKKKVLADRQVCDDFGKVMVTAAKPIDVKDLTEARNQNGTRVKLQITYDRPYRAVEDAEWDVSMGYAYVYIVDITEGTVTMIDCTEMDLI